MSYTVLARKWRPKNFSELVGQNHVMQALANALDQNRLHHAYLLTGTRGVGKTTIARIFAKALNCVHGVTSQPCGQCENCRAIDEGNFIDLIEVDAASKTKVDDTREILDNVQFAATQGRYKVYLIDEVHMLSKSSFNALLKTLEEPPEHVKFILATTDPHKLPITVLSRCLQFNLMRLTETQIQTHLAKVLDAEGLAYQASALKLLAKSADGSARDALSLLDQAIAYGAGQVEFEPVQNMLGLVDQQFTLRVLLALAEEDVSEIKQLIGELSALGVDYQALLAQLIEGLHAISFMQVFGAGELASGLPEDILQDLAASFSPERVQLLYQVALLTKQDMLMAPDIRIGFEMGLMRMLAFQPAQATAVSADSPSGANAMKPVANSATQALAGSSSGLSSAGVSTSGLGTTPVSPDEPSMIKDMALNDAMAQLSSARSLVGQKAKKKLSPEPVEPNESVAPFENLEKSVAGGSESRVAEPPKEKLNDPLGGQLGEQPAEPHFDQPVASVSATENVIENSAETAMQAAKSLNSQFNAMPEQGDPVVVEMVAEAVAEMVPASAPQVEPEAVNASAMNHLDELQQRMAALAGFELESNAAQPENVAGAEPVKMAEPEFPRAPNTFNASNIAHVANSVEATAATHESHQGYEGYAGHNDYERYAGQTAPETAVQPEFAAMPTSVQVGDTPVESAFSASDSLFEQNLTGAVGVPAIPQSEAEPHRKQSVAEAEVKTDAEPALQSHSQHEFLEAQAIGAGTNLQPEVPITASSAADAWVAGDDGRVNLPLWLEWIEKLNLAGMQREIALNSVLFASAEGYQLAIAPAEDFPHMQQPKQELLQQVVQFCQKPVVWQAWPDSAALQTPHQYFAEQAQNRQQAAKRSLQQDPFVQRLAQELDMQVLEQTFKAL